MWGVIAGAASRAQNLASNVKSVLLDEQDEDIQAYRATGGRLEHHRHTDEHYTQQIHEENGGFDGVGDHPPLSSRAEDLAEGQDFPMASLATFPSSQSVAAHQLHDASRAVDLAPPVGTAVFGDDDASSRLDSRNSDGSSQPKEFRPDPYVAHSGNLNAQGSTAAAAASLGGTAHHHSSPGSAVVGMGVGRMLGSATTTMSFFTSASSVLQKVATHVAGSEEAADGARHKPQVELLKQQLIEVTMENDALSTEVTRLRRALEDAEDSAELLQAQSQTAALLRQELTAEQRAHEATQREVERLVEKLRRVEQQLEGNAADVAQHDSFWKAELEQQRAAAAQAQSLAAELEGAVAQLRAQLEEQQQRLAGDAASKADGGAAEAAAAVAVAAAEGRVAALEAQLAASQSAADEAGRRLASLESELASLRQVAAEAAQRHAEELAAALQQQGTADASLSTAAASAAARAEAAEAWVAEAEERLQASVARAAELLARAEAAEGRLAEAGGLTSRAEARALAAEARAAELEAARNAAAAELESEVRRELEEAQAALAEARNQLRAADERGAADADAAVRLRERLDELERQLNEQREAHRAALVLAEQRAVEAEAAATAARATAAAAAAAAGGSGDGDDAHDGPLASMREQLEMMKELFEDEQRFGLQHRQQLEEERTAHAATKTKVSELQDELRRLAERLAEAEAHAAEAERRIADVEQLTAKLLAEAGAGRAEAGVKAAEAEARVEEAEKRAVEAESKAAAEATRAAEAEGKAAAEATRVADALQAQASMAAELRAEVNRLDVELRQRELELRHSKDKESRAVLELRTELEAAREACGAAEARADKVKIDLEAAVAALQKEVCDCEAVSGVLRVQLSELQGALAAAEATGGAAALAAAAAEVAELRGKLATDEAVWRGRLAAAEEAQASSLKQITALKEQVVSLSDEASAVAGQLDLERQERRREATEAEVRLKQAEEARASTAAAWQTAEARCRQLEGEVTAAGTAAASGAQHAQQELAAVQETVRQLSERLGEEVQRREELAHRAEAAEASCRRLQEALDGSEAACQQLTAELQQQRTAAAAAGSNSEELVSELAAASQRMGVLQKQVAQLQHALDEQANRSQTVLQERDIFWKKELSERAVAAVELERRLKLAQEQAARDGDALQELRSEVDRLRRESSAAAAAAVSTEASLRREVEALLTALERAQHSTVYGYGDHDSHVEKELAAVRAEVMRLQSEGRRLQSQLETAHAAAASAGSEASKAHLETRSLAAQLAAVAAERDAATAELRQLSHVYQQHLAQQREEMQQVVAAASASAAASTTQTPRLASRQESNLSPRLINAAEAATSGAAQAASATASAGGVGVGDGNVCGGGGRENGASESVAAAAMAALESEVAELHTALEAAEGERERLKGQLLRLKAQMLQEQEEEEDKVGWRVEAEVRAAEERYAGQVSELRGALEAAKAAAVRQQTEVTALTEALELKDTEIQNLQAALGELTYESEAAEKLRLEVRATANKVARLQQELAAARTAVAAEQAAKQAMDKLVEQARASLAAAAASEARTSDECVMLRRALDQAVAQAAAMSSETNGMVDRRIMGKLLLTYFQRNHSKEVLQLMAKILNMSDEDRATLGLVGGRRGLLSRVAGAPLALVSGAGRMLVGGSAGGKPGAAGRDGSATVDSLADQWVQFLLSQDEAAQRQQAALELQQQQQQIEHQQQALGQGGHMAITAEHPKPHSQPTERPQDPRVQTAPHQHQLGHQYQQQPHARPHLPLEQVSLLPPAHSSSSALRPVGASPSVGGSLASVAAPSWSPAAGPQQPLPLQRPLSPPPQQHQAYQASMQGTSSAPAGAAAPVVTSASPTAPQTYLNASGVAHLEQHQHQQSYPPSGPPSWRTAPGGWDFAVGQQPQQRMQYESINAAALPPQAQSYTNLAESLPGSGVVPQRYASYTTAVTQSQRAQVAGGTVFSAEQALGASSGFNGNGIAHSLRLVQQPTPFPQPPQQQQATPIPQQQQQQQQPIPAYKGDW